MSEDSERKELLPIVAESEKFKGVTHVDVDKTV
jgi:hypothetical protein